MGIERDKHRMYYGECTSCGDTQELEDAETFQGAVQELKESHGWIVKQHGGEWIHICPSCKEEMT